MKLGSKQFTVINFKQYIIFSSHVQCLTSPSLKAKPPQSGRSAQTAPHWKDVRAFLDSGVSRNVMARSTSVTVTNVSTKAVTISKILKYVYLNWKGTVTNL